MAQITIHCTPIKLPIQIDANLGMEFFEDHLIFLDFAENCATFPSDHLFTEAHYLLF